MIIYAISGICPCPNDTYTNNTNFTIHISTYTLDVQSN